MVRPPLPLLLTCGRHPVEAGQMSQVQSQRARVPAFATIDPGGRHAINSESTVIGLDLAKSVFQLHIVDVESGEIQRRQIKRAKLTEFFAKCNRSLVAMEACGSSHYWARTIRAGT